MLTESIGEMPAPAPAAASMSPAMVAPMKRVEVSRAEK